MKEFHCCVDRYLQCLGLVLRICESHGGGGGRMKIIMYRVNIEMREERTKGIAVGVVIFTLYLA